MVVPVARYVKASKSTLSLLDKCLVSMNQTKQIQAHLITSGTIIDPFAAGKIIDFCAISRRGDLNHAYLVFRHNPYITIFIWNTMIRAFVEKNRPFEALLLYKDMRDKGFLPNNYTFSFLLKACLDLSALLDGQKLHAQIVRLGWECYDFVLNGLIHMYANCKCIISARNLFETSRSKDVISWTAMVNGYAKLGRAAEARELFDQMPERNVVSWSTMLNCYTQLSMFKEALEIFSEMLLQGVQPNQAGIVGALSACASLGILSQGRWIHAYVDRYKMELDQILGTALVDMYSKCGCIETAHQIFNKMAEKDVFSWTSMISGLANHGDSDSAVKLFAEMQEEGIRPNEITFICVLNACSRMGLVEEGQIIFESMKSFHGIEPGIEHYGCLVDLLGRAGRLEEAKNVVREMPLEPDSYVLGALLNACRMHGEVDLGESTVKSLVGLRLDHGGVHALLSNIYASANRWKDVAMVRKDMGEKKMQKVPGCSLIEVDGESFEFVAGHRSHFLMEDMMGLMHGIIKQLESVRCNADALDCVMLTD
ncbi:pentatricopeptide repeat-containing protein At5g66520-like [Aristolochia californica]|uniref:pentatricopeptide repeat-containing protein At5g66520-like n=1 Tax=Aristolochia californica TaxID=171875 RepID=UPI0035DE1B61